jgi:3',5'-cyclic AMP phosphodiesterase CpdA
LSGAALSEFSRSAFARNQLSRSRWAILCALLVAAASPARAQRDFPNDLSGKPTFVVGGFKPSDPLKIVAYGDMRFTDPSNTYSTNPRVRKYLVDEIARERPDALLVSGDLPFKGGINADWDEYRRETKPWTDEKLRVYPVIGNHEMIPPGPDALNNYFAEFPWLGGRGWYSAQLGSVYLLALDSNSGHEETNFTDGPQRKWIESQLAHLPPEVNFVFFVIHMPLVNDVQSEVIADLPDPQEIVLRRYLESASKSTRAKFVVISGHVHNYERFELNGISYIVSGGGGAKPYPIFARSPQDLYRASGYPNFNYLTLQVHGKQADVTMYRVANPKAATLSMEVKERFTLRAK